MDEVLNLAEIKTRWNDVLDELESIDRVAWLAYFDGRLVSFKDGVLTLDFADPNKFSGGHDYSKVRHDRFRPALEGVLREIFEIDIAVREIS